MGDLEFIVSVISLLQQEKQTEEEKQLPQASQRVPTY